MKTHVKKWIIVGGATIIVIPIILNFILPLEFLYPTIGDEVTWLGFYGSYIGGIITAIFGFIALYTTSKQNRLHIEIQNQSTRIENLKQTLSNRLGTVQFWQVGSIALYLNNKAKFPEYAQSAKNDLNEYYKSVNEQVNAWILLYGTDDEAKAFNEKYREYSKQLITDIDEMTKLIWDLEKDYENNVTKINTYIKTLNAHNQEYLHSLLTAAQQWIKVEEDKLEKLKSQL